jgi:ATP-binding cassette subfamily A (ABC1) protein 3
VRCVGSSLFLKSRFGLGYNLSIAKGPLCDFQRLSGWHKGLTTMSLICADLVLGSIAGSHVVRHVGGEVAFSLPYNTTPAFPDFFDRFNEQQEALGVISYGLSLTTLEEVFLRLQLNVCCFVSVFVDLPG